MEKQLAGLPVHVHFVTEIREGARKETVAFEANGQYYVKGQGTYVTFQEPNEQGEVKTIIKIQDEQVLIMRSGAVSMRQTHVKVNGQLVRIRVNLVRLHCKQRLITFFLNGRMKRKRTTLLNLRIASK